jgi:hypothetical protein
MEEAEELSEPVLEKSLESVSEVASTVAASLESIDSEAVKNASGTGRGDSRPPGPLGEGDDVVPRFERWELKFQAKGLKDYAEQLDFYKIELACVGGGVNSVEYASWQDRLRKERAAAKRKTGYSVCTSCGAPIAR